MSQIRNTSRNSEVNANPVNPTADNLETMAHEAIDCVAETANNTVHGVRDAAARAAVTATRARDQAIEAAGESVQTVRSYAERNPFTTGRYRVCTWLAQAFSDLAGKRTGGGTKVVCAVDDRLFAFLNNRPPAALAARITHCVLA